MDKNQKISVGSRRSELALIQTNHVISLLKVFHPEKEFQIVTMNTLGDKVLDIPLPKIGEKSLFTKELETALTTGDVDFVVHSLKDLPTSLPNNMIIGAVLEREDPRDALVLHQDLKNHTLESLPKGSTIGTSSLRRAAQIHKYYPHLKVENIRGNLNTRLKKLDNSNKFQAIVLATAGLQRMGWHNRISKVIDDDNILYAVGQGALAIECREKDVETITLLKPLYNIHTAIRIIVERTFLNTLGGGCSAPVAIKTDLISVDKCKYTLTAVGAVWSLDGTNELKEKTECEIIISDNIYCYVCLHKNNINSNKCTSHNIECLKTCARKNKLVVESENGDPCIAKRLNEIDDDSSHPQATKRIKLDIEENVTKEIDPHDKCPVPLPIGAEFMGKCPYLDKYPTDNCSLNTQIEELHNNGIGKCPYLKKEKVIEIEDKLDLNCNQNLFCGLVPHPNVSIETFKEAERLGKELADKLLSKGAADIMAKAQAIIRNA